MLVEKKGNQVTQNNEKAFSLIEEVLATGNLANLNPEQRIAILKDLCDSLGLNYRTRPFEFITMNGRLVLYARKDCTDQLRNLHKVSIKIIDRSVANDVYVVTAEASYPDGRTDSSIGAVHIGGLRGDSLANAFMKAETKAKRRVTLSICGLGLLDESEVQDIPEVKNAALDQIEATAKPIPKSNYYNKPTERQLKRLFAITKASNWNTTDVTSLMHEKYGKQSSKELTYQEYEELCKLIESSPVKPIEDDERFPFEVEQENQ